MRHLFTTLFIGLILYSAAVASDSKVAIKQLNCEYRVNPLGIDVTEPRLGWFIESDSRCQKQTAYQILVAGSKKNLKKDKADLWDSGKISSNQTVNIVYKGSPLTSQMQCFWKVRVWDGDGKPSAWSEPARWTMGLLNPADFKAVWIGPSGPVYDNPLADAKWIWFPEGSPAQSARPGTFYFRKSLNLPDDLKIKKATCIMAADDKFVLFINGKLTTTGDNFKKPVETDITTDLKPGANLLAVAATNTGDANSTAGLIGIIKVELASAAPVVIPTDISWKTWDAEKPGWEKNDYNDIAWRPAMRLGVFGEWPWGDISTHGAFCPPAHYLRKDFKAAKAVSRATVYASALGLYELRINGNRIGSDYFTPGWTDYGTRVYYNTYDVTALLKKGNNALAATIADGWYAGYIGWGHKRYHYGKLPRLLAQLELEFTDGSTQTIATGPDWKTSTGPLLEADFLMGAAYDAAKELPGWDAPGFNDSAWEKCLTEQKPSLKIQAYPGIPVRKFAEVKPVSVTEPVKGAYVFNMGQNFAGWARLKTKGKAGDKIVLRFAERLNPDGTIYTTNLRSAKATDTYICRGSGEEIWQPQFTFHGFQYVEVTGLQAPPSLDTITGIAVSSDLPVTGAFECSDPTANKLYSNICWTQRANFIDIPTDCPQRDERLGWMGDAQIFIRTATYNMDCAAFFTKWLVDIEDAQLPNGAFSDVAPRRVGFDGGVAAWADAGVICPWTIYQVYGDKRILAKHYNAMARWIDYCKGTTKDLLRPEHGYGDWLSINADTPKDVLATAYFAYSTKLMAQIAQALEKNDDAAKYNQLFEQIRQAFNKAYVAEDARIKGSTQTVYVLALAFDLLPEDKRPLAVKYLVDDIEARGWHLSTGFVGTKDLMQVLTKVGRTDVAYRLFHNDTFPSWGFSIKQGATSIWERWDGWTPEKGFQDPGMNSFAHYSFGAVAEWMFKTIGGIDTDGPAFERIIIKPQPGGKLTWAKTNYNSIHGKIAAYWRTENGKLKLDITIPANTTATVYIPAKDAGGVTEGRTSAEKAKGVRFLRTENNNAVFSVCSGQYQFVSKL